MLLASIMMSMLISSSLSFTFINLTVEPYAYQLGSLSGQGSRMCFSSTCSMLVDALNPAQFNPQSQHQDQYLHTLNALGGDSTDSRAQIETLKKYGIQAEFKMNGNLSVVLDELKNGIPVPVGLLHHGSLQKPSGGGHWTLLIGWIEKENQVIMHDPYGKADLDKGEYISNAPTAGKYVVYDAEKWIKRWEVEGSGSGW
jgi:hypothetical protein